MTSIPSVSEIRSIYSGVQQLPMMELDLQGWNSHEPIFEKLMRELRPKVVVEVGVWKGASVVHMAKISKSYGMGTLFYAVDVFHGLKGFSIGEIPSTMIPPLWSTPTLYQQFLFNMRATGMDDCVIPVPTFSLFGARIIENWGVKADLVYIDAGHDEPYAYADIMAYWPLLRSGGVMFGDDWSYEGVSTAVLKASARFGVASNLDGGHWFMRKP